MASMLSNPSAPRGASYVQTSGAADQQHRPSLRDLGDTDETGGMESWGGGGEEGAAEGSSLSATTTALHHTTPGNLIACEPLGVIR